jgi:hypothetical protein
MEIAGIDQVMDLLLTDGGYTPEQNAAITAWLEERAARKAELREAITDFDPAYVLRESVQSDSTSMYKPVHRWAVEPDGRRIGWIEPWRDGWRGWDRPEAAYAAPVRASQHEAVIDVFTEYLYTGGGCRMTKRSQD